MFVFVFSVCWSGRHRVPDRLLGQHGRDELRTNEVLRHQGHRESVRVDRRRLHSNHSLQSRRRPRLQPGQVQDEAGDNERHQEHHVSGEFRDEHGGGSDGDARQGVRVVRQQSSERPRHRHSHNGRGLDR